MPSLQSFSITPTQAVQVNNLNFTIACQVFDDNNNLVADFTGANAIQYPACLATLTQQQQSDILQKIVNDIIFDKAGLQ